MLFYVWLDYIPILSGLLNNILIAVYTIELIPNAMNPKPDFLKGKDGSPKSFTHMKKALTYFIKL
ncbi:hypothetical protein D7Z94_25250 [Ulvibacterium marinum]|uniref:Uncharacterized protein n=1 Tax=Ulvibacterium marinum TaxID=2419782 RepID=A0A3B0BQP4_9FLAO|nr:hypothetical protein D7Z94_25250 [Ulvibacterium marinum]